MVKTVILPSSPSMGSPSWSHRVKSTSAPSERPIQLACICLTRSGQPGSFSRSSSSSWEYSVILKYHCSRSRFSGSVPQRQHLPSVTCSLARTVLQVGHQLTGFFLR